MTKNAFITGANRGIGLEVAKQLLKLNFKVFIGVRDLERGEAAKVEIGELGQGIDCIEVEVSDPRSIQKATTQLASQIDQLDVLVNNAGIFPDEAQTILDISPEHLSKTLATNTFGPLLLSQKLWPLLSKGRPGRVINVSSGLGQLNDMAGDAPSYSISKTALNAITRQLAFVGIESGVVVNSVCPGWVKTDMGGPNAEREIEEGADTIVWLASEAPDKLTGGFYRDRKQIEW